MSTTLERMNIAAILDSEITAERQRLASVAAERLGYRQLSRRAIPLPLLTELRKLDITPFSTKSVDQYKAAKVKVHLRANYITALYWAAAVVVFGIAARLLWNLPFTRNVVTVSFVAFCILGVISAIGALIIARDSEMQVPRHITHWKRVSLRDYQKDVPEMVLSRAIIVHEEIAGATFYVDYLFREVDENDAARVRYKKREAAERRERYMADPFLVVELGSESYYLDVWDEHEYESLSL
jgi:hypothetical protein